MPLLREVLLCLPGPLEQVLAGMLDRPTKCLGAILQPAIFEAAVGMVDRVVPTTVTLPEGDVERSTRLVVWVRTRVTESEAVNATFHRSPAGISRILHPCFRRRNVLCRLTHSLP